ncbi:uncharacterized protein [Eurosta solidaginis]|uniref:uncharacterized protein isoform X2 n=1 Tax=Eurosta solidaginis TaxID=178769 RepID=UPI0035310E87
MLKVCKINACPNGTIGLHLSRAPWDPYPWVSGIQEGSSAEEAGMRIGDTVLQFNGNDVLGKRILEIATRMREHWQSGATDVSVVIWRNETEANGCCSDETDDVGDADEEEYNATDSNDSVDETIPAKNKRKSSYQHQQNSSINQQSLQKFATCLQHIAQLLECPVCLEVIRPPGWQCCNGHVLCNNCRSRSVKCPVCRVPLGPRGRCLLADKLFNVLAESFPCDGVRSNQNSPQCSPESKGVRTACTAAAERHSNKQKHHQQQQQQIQQTKAKEMQQKDVKKVKTAVTNQKNGSNGKVAAKECTTTINDVQQVNRNSVDTSNRNKDELEVSRKKSVPKLEGNEYYNSSLGCRWQWLRGRTRTVKDHQQEQGKVSTSKILQVYKRHADEQLYNTVSRAMTTMKTTNGSS